MKVNSKGKLIQNKQAETIVKAIETTWILTVGFPSIGFYADNGGEFANHQLQEFCDKNKLSLKFGPAHSPFSNGLNERNHASADCTIKKLLAEDITPRNVLNDDLVAAAAWTHNTCPNRFGYSPMLLATGKAVTVPGLTYGNVIQMAHPTYIFYCGVFILQTY